MLSYEKSVKKAFFHILYLMQKSYQWGQKAYLIQNMCRYDSYRVQSADIVLEKKEIKTSCASKYFCNLLLIPSFN